jgi:hypothetical protein
MFQLGAVVTEFIIAAEMRTCTLSEKEWSKEE